MRLKIALILVMVTGSGLRAQAPKSGNLVYVDNTGILRWTKDNREASFFGVNYTTPFAYAYRAQKKLNIDLEKAIQQDVYHFARLGLTAFRVHVWDTEISDTVGNLLENDHLRLFDFLLAELAKRNIKTIITPIAFWGNGYPDRDEMTPGFARKYGKGGSTANDTAIRAQENYLTQFFKHTNPYTNRSYVADTNVIAAELNNEPSHSGPKKGVTDYINRLAVAVRNTGWTKPVYYNISQSPYYGDAVAKANIDGVSFQWYPTGLVTNREVQGNFLPNVDHYTIPYDTIPEYRNKSRMVYEFDAADVLRSYMYPAIARSFREAGFQWATQFAYDPMQLAHVNTEYQTHYLNLAYTPSKAISFMIAGEAFRRLPRLKNYGNYPTDSLFDVFRVSYKNDLSEMNSEQKFFYSNSTISKPVNTAKLQAIAGVGNSAIIRYTGTGAYFLDKLEDGAWRLEVMPDAIRISDPFERASMDKTVTGIQWRSNAMKIMLEDLGNGFTVKPLNDGNSFSTSVAGNSFEIQPGTYLLTRPGKKSISKKNIGVIALNEFVAPAASPEKIFAAIEKAKTTLPIVDGKLQIFDPSSTERTARTYPVFNRNFRTSYTTGEAPVLKLTTTELSGDHTIGFQQFIGDKLKGVTEINEGDELVIRARTTNASPVKVKIVLTNKDAVSFSSSVTVTNNFQDIVLPLKNFMADSALLLPRPYPGFMALRFKASGSTPFKLNDVEKIEITAGSELPISEFKKQYDLEIGSIWFQKHR
ncbi:MAG: membrane or secreted protein [Bacteroidota bacterium]